MTQAKASVRVAWSPPRAHAVHCLGPADASRIAHLDRDEDRIRSATGRVLLRALVGRVAGVEACSVVIESRCPVCGAAHGQPQVADPPAPRLHVSVAHAANRVLVAASTLGPLGVDIEPVDAACFAGFDQIALTSAERAAVERRPIDERTAARTSLWVRKEALLKMSGYGLTSDPRNVAASAAMGTRLIEVDAGDGYIAWLAVRARRQVRVVISDATTWPEMAAVRARTTTA